MIAGELTHPVTPDGTVPVVIQMGQPIGCLYDGGPAPDRRVSYPNRIVSKAILDKLLYWGSGAVCRAALLWRMIQASAVRRRGWLSRLLVRRPRQVDSQERPCRRDAGFFQHPLAQRTLIFGFLPAPERREQLNQPGPCLFIMRLKLHERAGKWQSRLRPGFQPLDERPKDSGLQCLQLRTLGDAPGMKLVAVLKIQPCQVIPAECFGQRSQVLG